MMRFKTRRMCAARASSVFCVAICCLALAISWAKAQRPKPANSQSYDAALSALRQRTQTLRDQYQSLNWPADSAPAIGKLLGSNPQTCAAFVRRSIRFEPYQGILRGAEGTLAAGGGSCADAA